MKPIKNKWELIKTFRNVIKVQGGDGTELPMFSSSWQSLLKRLSWRSFVEHCVHKKF